MTTLLKYDIPNRNIEKTLETITNDYNKYHHDKLLKLQIQNGENIDDQYYGDKEIVYTIKFTNLGSIYFNGIELLSIIENQGFEKAEDNESYNEYDLCLDYNLYDYITGYGSWHYRIIQTKTQELKYYNIMPLLNWEMKLYPYVTYSGFEDGIYYYEYSPNTNIMLNNITVTVKNDKLTFENYRNRLGEHVDGYKKEYSLPKDEEVL